MTKLYFITFLILFTAFLSIFGQVLPKKSLIADLTYLNEAVIHGHPVNFNPERLIHIQEVINSANQIKSDSVSAHEYTLWIEKGIYNIGCVHTSIQKNPIATNKQKPYFIPLTASIQNNKLMITSCADSSKTGQVIERINGVSVNEIIERYMEYKASDGNSDAFATEYFHFASSKLISNFLNNVSQYQIQTSNGEFELAGNTTIYSQKNKSEKIISTLENGECSLYVIENFAVLKINSFIKNDKQYFKSFFSKLTELKLENLILDLRQNTGGNRSTAIELTKYLVDKSFGYSILQPKLSTKKYLNRKGKKFLFLSKLKYNLGNIFNSHKTSLGREFRYSYTPKTKNNFNGKIFVLTDGFTASSSTMVTSWLKQFTNATFIGRQASGGYNGNNGGAFPLITLPQSKIEIKFPAYRLILDKNSIQNSGIIPNILLDTNISLKEIIKQLEKIK